MISMAGLRDRNALKNIRGERRGMPADGLSPADPNETNMRVAPGAAEKSDILVIGGGPAGSTAAALLSEKGWRVSVLEMDHHPRFHIGESLLPGNMPLFERLGVMQDLERIGMVKRAIDFTMPPDDSYVTFEFSRAQGFTHTSAFQVRRSEFDHILLKNAQAKGAVVHEGIEAKRIAFDEGAPVTVHAVDQDGEEGIWTADFLVDASGRNTLLANQFGLKRRNPRHNSAAIFAHFKGAVRRPGDAEGNISVYWIDHGWLWLIPLRDGMTSVGAVVWPRYLKTRDCGIEEFFRETIDRCPPLAKRLCEAEPVTPVNVTGNYSYYAKKMYGKHYLMVGDSFGFIDPVFSSGVYLAMYAAFSGADAIDASLRDPARKAGHLRRHSRTISRGIDQLSWFIYRFTSPAIQHMFMAPKNYLNMQDGIISMLAGDVFETRGRWIPLIAFKTIYRLLTLANPRWARTTDIVGDDAIEEPSAVAK